MCLLCFRADAMLKIQDCLRNKEAAEGVAMLRAARWRQFIICRSMYKKYALKLHYLEKQFRDYFSWAYWGVIIMMHQHVMTGICQLLSFTFDFIKLIISYVLRSPFTLRVYLFNVTRVWVWWPNCAIKLHSISSEHKALHKNYSLGTVLNLNWCVFPQATVSMFKQ